MKLQINIEYTNGELATYTAQPPEWAKWEQKTGNTIQQAQDKVGISDLMFLAFNAMKREAGGKPVKPYEAWSETIADISVGESDPKATSAEA
ncbi:hypothetical protein UFOVP1399_4 [uncultured Caudovirales phage]|jgi:hypothetical protein|uniref:Uncharacterized protein n=1 Tax=uncultured Caudovirales phage TaxID=2100421 RepID=A0A6J5S7M4_9CAUD|nr:hypothetical protein UFOVP1399_4 [uncultured Caudovirales phage]